MCRRFPEGGWGWGRWWAPLETLLAQAAIAPGDAIGIGSDGTERDGEKRDDTGRDANEREEEVGPEVIAGRGEDRVCQVGPDGDLEEEGRKEGRIASERGGCESR